MSKTSLRKVLKGMDREALAELVCDLYDARREARDYLEYWLQPDLEAAFEKAREEAGKKFFYSSGKPRGLPSATEIKKLVKDYSSISFDPKKTATLLLHIAETEAAWLSARTTSYAAGLRSLEKNVENARVYVEQSGLDETRSKSVIRVFCDLYEKGLIYRGVRMVNWDPQALTALSMHYPYSIDSVLLELLLYKGRSHF